jgi:hypothetical protein
MREVREKREKKKKKKKEKTRFRGVREVREKKKKKKKRKKKNAWVFYSHFSLCVFIWNDEVSACDWRAEKPSFLHQPDSSCSHSHIISPHHNLNFLT